MTPINNFYNFIKFAKDNIEIEFESPRKEFGHSNPPQNFKIKEVDENKRRIIIEFKSGTLLPLEYWRFEEALLFIDKNEFVPIGASINEKYQKDSLEGVLKEIAKKKYHKKTDTKTAPHIADLLQLAGISELGETKSSNNRIVQGIKLIEP